MPADRDEDEDVKDAFHQPRKEIHEDEDYDDDDFEHGPDNHDTAEEIFVRAT